MILAITIGLLTFVGVSVCFWLGFASGKSIQENRIFNSYIEGFKKGIERGWQDAIEQFRKEVKK